MAFNIEVTRPSKEEEAVNLQIVMYQWGSGFPDFLDYAQKDGNGFQNCWIILKMFHLHSTTACYIKTKKKNIWIEILMLRSA